MIQSINSPWPGGVETEVAIGKFLDGILQPGTWDLQINGTYVSLTWRCEHGQVYCQNKDFAMLFMDVLTVQDLSAMLPVELSHMCAALREFHKASCSTDPCLVKSPSSSLKKPPSKSDMVRQLRRFFPSLLTTKIYECPWRIDCDTDWTRGADLDGAIMHLNDVHRWSRERIADWLETLDTDLTIKKPEPETIDVQFHNPYIEEKPLDNPTGEEAYQKYVFGPIEQFTIDKIKEEFGVDIGTD